MIRLSIKEEFSIIEVGAKLKSGGFTRNNFITEEKISWFRGLHNNTDVYTTVYNYNNTNQNESDLYGPMYFDLDNKDIKDVEMGMLAFQEIREDAKKILAILEAIFYVPQEQIQIYFSGGKGLHIVVPQEILGIHPRKDLNSIYRYIAMDVKKYLQYNTMDTQIYDNKRLFRIPNSIHGGTGLYKIPLTANELRSLSYTDIKLLATQPREVMFERPMYSTRANRMYQKFVDQWEDELRKLEERRTKGNGNTQYTYTPPCILKLLEFGVMEGNRNNTIAVLCSHYKQNGLSEAECTNRMEQFNKTMVVPPLNNNEVDRTVRSIYNAEYGYGCRALYGMGLCDKDKCKIAQNRDKKERGK